MDPSTDRFDGDPYSALVRYEWIGLEETVPVKIKGPNSLDTWATFKSHYVREYTAPSNRGVQKGSWVTKMDEDGTVYLLESDGWFLDQSPESLATERTIKLEIS